ncbi:MAG: oxidoreductase [Deltaproteobacteria bacterium]|nr:oxidoreductase [Deltaproteobacteria bacterium]
MLLRYPARSEPAARTVAAATSASHPATAKRDGRIGIAVIGGGGFATETLLPAIGATPDFALRTVVTRSSASAAKVAQEFGAAQASTDPEGVLADPSVDAVVIATRHDSHAPLALAALRAGKHVFLEKPMGITREQIDALRDEALTSGRIFTVGYNRRYAPLSLRVREWLATSAGPAVLLYRVNAGHVPAENWTLDPNVGGGRIVGELCHMLDLLSFWLGPELVSWSAAALPSAQRAAPSPQDVVVSLRFRDANRNEHVASLVYTSLGAPALAKEWIEVHAGGCTLHLTDFMRLEAQGARARTEVLRKPDKGHRAEIEAFRDAIRGAPNALLGAEEAWASADLALRIDQQLRAGAATE